MVNFYVPGYVRTGLSSTLRRAGNTIKARFTDINDQVIDLYVVVRPEVIQALGRADPGGASMESRANAARAVGVLRGAAAIPELLAAVRSKDSQLMYEGLVALRKINVRSAATEITSTVRDPDSKVQVAAIETAGLLVNKEALPDLREVLKTTRDRAVRRAALTAVARLPDAANRGAAQPLPVRQGRPTARGGCRRAGPAQGSGGPPGDPEGVRRGGRTARPGSRWPLPWSCSASWKSPSSARSNIWSIR